MSRNPNRIGWTKVVSKYVTWEQRVWPNPQATEKSRNYIGKYTANFSHRDFKRWRVRRDGLGTWEIHISLKGEAVFKLKRPKSQDTEEGGREVRVNHSSNEARNDRRAKGWQIMIVFEGNWWPYKQKTEIKKNDNKTRTHRQASNTRERHRI